MDRRSKSLSDRQIRQVIRLLLRLPPAAQAVIVLLLLVVVTAVLWTKRRDSAAEPSAAVAAGAGDLLLCHWNFENLFDDQDDPRQGPDEEYDNWMARDAVARQLKYERLAEALLRLGSGRGPDIIVGNEVESRRAAELLRDTLNARLPEGATPYQYLAMEELKNAGRHIAPCIISRLPVRQPRLLGRRLRILEAVVVAQGHELVIIAAHWTSQLSDKGDDPNRGRNAYAATIYERYCEWIRRDAAADVLVCGDFNTTPDDPVLTDRLRMTGDRATVMVEQWPPKLLGLLSGRPPEQYGTIYYRGPRSDGSSGPLIYDHVAVSAGLLDSRGWSCLPESVQVPTEGLIRPGSRTRQPWRFGSPKDDALGRGYSDHFPVTVVLRVHH